MISRKNRFHGHGSLQFLYKNGRVARSQAVSLKYVVNPKRAQYRLAVVVSRKVSKSAVVRNRIRRRLYEAVRLAAVDFVGVYDLALMVYDERIAVMEPKMLQKEVQTLLRKSGIISSKPAPRGIVDGKE